MAGITFPYSNTADLSLNVDDRNLGEVVRPAPVAPAPDWGAAIDAALDAPLGTPPLEQMVRPGQRVLVLSDDNTRPTPVGHILPKVLDRLARSGVAASDVEVLIAAGTHRPMTDPEIEAKLGPEMVRKVRVSRHRCDDADALVRVTGPSAEHEIWLNRKMIEADFVLGIGNVVPHPHVGWSGGAKLVYPGVAGAATVASFHLVGVESPLNSLGRDDAPARVHLEDLAETVGLGFAINTVLTSDHRLYRVFSGNPRLVQRAGRESAREIYGVPVARRYDIVLSNAYPAVLEFWQAGKAIFSGDLMLNPGGTIILTAPCPEGIGVTHPDQVEYLALGQEELLNRIAKRQVKDAIAAGVCALLGHIKKRAKVLVVSPGLRQDDVRTMGFAAFDTVKDALEAALAVYGSQAEVAVITHGGETVPVLGDGNTAGLGAG
jgi:nickel-dependent lactate racemase